MRGDLATSLGAQYLLLRNRFREAGLSSPELDARVLLGDVAGVEPSQIPLHMEMELSGSALERLKEHLARRLTGEPVGRILGKREFWGLEFRLNEATLEPRPDTEILVEAVLARCDPKASPRMVDIGTGTGAIAVALLSELPRATCVAVDISGRALECACENARAHHVADRFLPVQASYLSAFAGAGALSAVEAPQDGCFDWVISNPPYIVTSVLAGLEDEVRLHDPGRALDGGPDGLVAYREIVAASSKILASRGWIALEIGFDQAEAVAELLLEHNFKSVEIIQDLGGRDRVLVAQRQEVHLI